MIFVTVGTHEQSFNRLLKYMDLWANKHKETVVMQIGFSDYIPVNCKWKAFFTHDEMKYYIKKSRIIIIHGGPSSFIDVLLEGKVPIIVPRRFELGEHINNHQKEFCKKLKDRNNNVIVVNNIYDLENIIETYDKENHVSFKSHNQVFCNNLERCIKRLSL